MNRFPFGFGDKICFFLMKIPLGLSLTNPFSITLVMCFVCWLMSHLPIGDDYQGGAGKLSCQEDSTNGASQGGVSVSDLIPPAQRVLFMRIQQKQQEEDDRARRMDGGAEKSRDTEG